MAGHSKWANIKHKKAAVDRKKGRVFSKLARELMVAAKEGGSDADANPRLRTALAAAKAVNMPNENVSRAIKKGAGELDGVNFEDIIYEAYGPEGVALLIRCLTDNRNRTAGEVRMVLDRRGGNLASSGAVSRMFNRKSRFKVVGEKADEDTLMEVVVEAGADDMEVNDDVAEILGPPEAFDAIAAALEAAGIEAEESEIVQQPDNFVEVACQESARKILNLVECLEELDDVQSVHGNFDFSDEVLATLEDE